MKEGQLIAIGIVVLFFALASVDWTAIEQAKEDRLAEARTQRIEEIQQKHPSWTVEDCELIVDRKIRLGMTKEMVRLSWGWPSETYTSISLTGTYEAWEYLWADVYFRDGILIRWAS